MFHKRFAIFNRQIKNNDAKADSLFKKVSNYSEKGIGSRPKQQRYSGILCDLSTHNSFGNRKYKGRIMMQLNITIRKA